jgi:hypothetical protein
LTLIVLYVPENYLPVRLATMKKPYSDIFPNISAAAAVWGFYADWSMCRLVVASWYRTGEELTRDSSARLFFTHSILSRKIISDLDSFGFSHGIKDQVYVDQRIYQKILLAYSPPFMFISLHVFSVNDRILLAFNIGRWLHVEKNLRSNLLVYSPYIIK